MTMPYESQPLHGAQLIASTADEAYIHGDYVVCDSLIAQYESRHPGRAELQQLKGRSLLAQGHYEAAIEALDKALGYEQDLRTVYLLACAHAGLDCHEYVVASIDDTLMQVIPEAAALRMRALHRLGRLDEAITLGMQWHGHIQHGQDICGLLATILIDDGRSHEAHAYAELAGDTYEGCVANGILALDLTDYSSALLWFRHAIALQPRCGRARLGEGLCLLEYDNYAAATLCFDQAAALLDGRACVWVASAWVHLLNQALPQARARFQRACQADNGFAEAYGGLAIVCLYEGQVDHAMVYAEQAMRLDRECLSGMLARSLLLMHSGATAAAQALRSKLVRHPMGRDGSGIARQIARRAVRYSFAY
ncbi:hypothetical protein [Dyella sp.]|uniref:hypothetical protein n=1 Tax=Dyella sp. TaxID=1869338 RepID=UPI002ED4FBD8